MRCRNCCKTQKTRNVRTLLEIHNLSNKCKRSSRDSPSKSMRAIARDLNVSKGLIRRVIHEVLRYKSYVMRRGQFISAQTRNHRLIRGKRLLNKLKHPIVPNMLGFNPTKKILTKTKEPIGEMTGGYAQILQRFPVLCARSFPQLSSFKEL